jgi:voltage-gated potassium channel
MVAVPTGILATGFAFELRRRRDAYHAELREALKDGTVDVRERQHLEEVRKALDLDEADAADLEAATWSFPSSRSEGRGRLITCPHCGELLDGSEVKPMSPTDPSL